MSFMQSLFKAPKTNVQFPERSPEETALLREQTNILREQHATLQESLRQQNLLQPLLFSQLGLREVRDASGKVTGYEKAALTPEQEQQQQIETKLRERTLAALEGTLPVDPALERELTAGRTDLAATLERQLGGPGGLTSSPAIEAFGDFDERAASLRFGARRDMLTTAEALAGAREARTAQRDALTFGNLMSTAGADLPFIGAGTGIGTAFSGPLQNMLQDRALNLNARTSSAANALAKYKIQVERENAEAQRFADIFGGSFGAGTARRA